MDNKDNQVLTPEEQRRKARAKIRTIRIWAFIVLSLLAVFGLLSNCALSKPKAKQAIVDSCVKNVPFSEKWQADLKTAGLEGKSEQVIHNYCICMWDEPLEKLSEKQIQSLSSLSPQEQLDLLGGVQAFEARDQQCIASLTAKAK
ncbi:hypothetical protein [Neisseria dumasiana]|uniref:Uncharacterized protein n=1 Tax=Neisseria dumasiana TaxID=1931275 RepID=A0ABX3WPE7_9NEIS|nr:hypothetical protein [Neisseria dumasiana]OSI36152.1 hypothetical protein BV913_03070 [Neisseria dumasiana]UOO83483.1 hypothetical protein LVJ88_07085 [Neisseria dumasiana]